MSYIRRMLLGAVCFVVFIDSFWAGARSLGRPSYKGETLMFTTSETVKGYFEALRQKKDWASFFSDDVVFTSYTSPIRRISGKDTFVQGTKRFYSTFESLELKDLIVDGERACAITHYRLNQPGTPAFESDVAEIFRVRNGKIVAFDIYFDSAPYPK